MQPLVHILIPVYNHKRFLFDSLHSVLNQSYSNIRVIVVNDGSTEDVEEIFNLFGSDPRLQIHCQENSGLSYTLNRLNALSASHPEKAEFVTWHSADNIYELHAIEELVNFLSQHQEYDLAYANVRLIDDQNNAISSSCYRKDDQMEPDSSHLNLDYPFQSIYQCSDNFINACFLVRESVERILPLYKSEDRGIEDYVHWLQLSLVGNGSHIKTSEPLYRYRLHNQTMSSEYLPDELPTMQQTRVSVANKIQESLSYDSIPIMVTDKTKNLLLKRKNPHTLNSFEKFLSSHWSGQDLEVTANAAPLCMTKSDLVLSSDTNSLFDLNLSFKDFFKIRPCSVSLESPYSSSSRYFTFEGIVNNLSFLARSRNRNLGMFSNDNDRPYLTKYLLLIPSKITREYSELLIKFVTEHPDFLFVLTAFGNKEKSNADEIYLQSNLAKNIRIVSSYDSQRTLLESNDGTHTRNPLISALSSTSAILSNSLFTPTTYTDFKLELILANLSLKLLLINSATHHTDNPCLSILDFKNKNNQVYKQINGQSACDSFLKKASDPLSVRRLVSALFVESI